ALRPPVQKRE
ncbi:hypothetical protein D027_0592B, partial [Vibrio parahaemolyticus 861]